MLIGADQADACLRARLPRRSARGHRRPHAERRTRPGRSPKLLGAEHVAALPTAEPWLVDRFAERSRPDHAGPGPGRDRRPGRRGRQHPGRWPGGDRGRRRPAHPAGRRRSAGRRPRPGARLGAGGRAALAGAGRTRAAGSTRRRCSRRCRTAATWCCCRSPATSCSPVPGRGDGGHPGRRPPRPRRDRSPTCPASSTTRRRSPCRPPTGRSWSCRPSCGRPRRRPGSRRRSALHCENVAVVVRGPAPGRLRPREVARALGLPLAGSLRPEPAMCQALERGEAPAADGAGPLAELCKRLIGDLTAGRPDRGGGVIASASPTVHRAGAAAVRGRRGGGDTGGRGGRGAAGDRSAAVLGDTTVLRLADQVHDELVGAGPLAPLLADPAVTDVLVNGVRSGWTGAPGCSGRRSRSGGPTRSAGWPSGWRPACGRRLDDGQPYADARLPDGTRLHAVLPPVATDRAVPVVADLPAAAVQPRRPGRARDGRAGGRAGAGGGRGGPAGLPGHRRHRQRQDDAAGDAAGPGAADRADRAVKKHFPAHGIIGEEFGNEREDAEYVWVLDPIDGTGALFIPAWRPGAR